MKKTTLLLMIVLLATNVFAATTYFNTTGNNMSLGNALFIDNSNGRVGIGTIGPTTPLQVSGTLTATTFSGAGTSLTGTAASLSIGGNAATATSASDLSCTNCIGYTEITDGSGSGLDADTLDSYSSLSFSKDQAVDHVSLGTDANDMRSTNLAYYGRAANNGNFTATYGVIYPFENYPGSSGDGSAYITQLLFSHPSNNIYIRNSGGNGITWSSWYLMWNSENDGSGSGLDADLLDGVSSASFSQLGSSVDDTELTAEDFGDFTCTAGEDGCTVDANSIALTTDTTGNYAAGDGEAGNALTGDTATAFFSSGTLEDSLLSFTLQDAVDDGGCTDCITNAMVSDTLTASSVACAGVTGNGVGCSDVYLNAGGDTITGTLAMNTQEALVASNYGMGVYGLYSPTRYQHVWSMGTSYDLPSDGLDETGAAGNLYGLAWTYNPDYDHAGSNPQAKAGLNHQLLLMMDGTTYTALGNGIWTAGTVTANSFTGAGTGLTGTAASLTSGAVTNGIYTTSNWAGGDLSGTGLAATVAANSVALTTDTTGNYAAGDAEAGAALTGDTATAFFSSGTLEVARGGTGVGTSTGSGNVVLSASPTFTGTVVMGALSISAPIYRSAAGTGYLNGGYNSIESTTTSGAIYSIGGSYVPGSTDLGNMYGIGYGYSGGGGITFSGLPNDLWGMYAASGGTPSIFLSSGDGKIYITGSYNGAGTGLTGTAASLNIGGNAATATSATNSNACSGDGACDVATISFAAGPTITTDGATRINLNAASYVYVPTGTFYVESGSVLRGGISDDGGNLDLNDNVAVSGTLTAGGNTVWNAGNDGAGTGLDADTLDGYNSAQSGASVILRSDSSGYLGIESWIRVGSGTGLYNTNGAYFYEDTTYGWFSRSRTTTSSIRLQSTDGTAHGWWYSDASSNQGFLSTAGSWRLFVPNSGSITRDNAYTMWDSGNDGAGTGLDADLLDGISSAGFDQSNSNEIQTLGTSGTTITLTSGGSVTAPYATYTTSLRGAASTIYGTYGSGYGNAVQVREADLGGAQGNAGAAAPRLAFHWGGVVASSIMVEPSGRIAITDNPGTSYEDFAANDITGNDINANDITANAFYYSSDENLKANITILNNSINKIMKLNGVSFNWKKDGRTSVGVIAQNIETEYPEIVHIDNATGFKTVEYGNLAGPLIEAVKELNAKNEATASAVNDLNTESTKQIKELNNRLNKQEQENKKLRQELSELKKTININQEKNI